MTQKSSIPSRREEDSLPRISWAGVLISIVVMGLLLVLTLTHLSEARRFMVLAERAEPKWLLLALGLQLATYFCAGGIWGVVWPERSPSCLAAWAVSRLAALPP